MQKTNILKDSCPKNVILMKAKNNNFLTFLDKMQFSEILCLATYDWFCADGSQISNLLFMPSDSGKCNTSFLGFSYGFFSSNDLLGTHRLYFDCSFSHYITFFLYIFHSV